MLTLTQRLISYISSFATEQQSKSRKYRLFLALTSKNKKTYYHVGRNGTVRVSKTGNTTDSFSVSDIMKQRMQTWEKTCESRSHQ